MRHFFLIFFTFLLILQSCKAPNNNFEGNISDFKNKINSLNKSFKSEKLSFSKKDIYHYEDFSYQPIGFYVTTIEKNAIGHTYILKSGGSESFVLNTDEYSKQGYFAYSFSYDSNNNRWKISIASQDYYIPSSGGSITHNQEIGNYKASYTVSLSINDESLTISCNGYSEDKLNYSTGPWSSDYSQYYNPEIHNRYYYTFYTTEFRRDISNSQTFPIRVEKTPNFSIIKLENNQVRFEPENKTYPWRGKIVLSSPKFRCNQSYSQEVSGTGDKTYTLPDIDGEYSIEVIYEKHPESVFTGTLTIDSGINLNITFEKINNTLKVKPSDINKSWKGMITRTAIDPQCLSSPAPSPEPFSFEVFGTGEKIIDFPNIDATYLVQINYTECVTDSLFTTTMQVTDQCNNPPPTPTPTITPVPTPTITPVPTPSPSPTATQSPSPTPTVTPTPSPTPPQPTPTLTSTPTPEPSPTPSSANDNLTMNYIIGFGNEKDYSNMGDFNFRITANSSVQEREAVKYVERTIGSSVKGIRHVLKLSSPIAFIFNELINARPTAIENLVNVNFDNCDSKLITGAISIPELLNKSEDIYTNATVLVRKISNGQNVALWTVPLSKTQSFSIKWDGKYNTGANSGEFVEPGGYNIFVIPNDPKITKSNYLAPVYINVSSKRICVDKDKPDFIRYGSQAEALEAEKFNILSLKEGTYNQNKWIGLSGFIIPRTLGDPKYYTHEIRIFVWNKNVSLNWLNQGVPSNYWLSPPRDDFFGDNAQVKSNEPYRWGIYPTKLDTFNLQIKKIISVERKK